MLGVNTLSVVPSICMASGVLGFCFVSGIPSIDWLPVKQKFSAEVVNWNLELRGGGVFGSSWVSVKAEIICQSCEPEFETQRTR